MKKITFLFTMMIAALSYGQQNSPNQETIPIEDKKNVPQEAEKGTFQLVFKDKSSKIEFFKTGILTCSEYIGIGGIDSYSDLLIVLSENRSQSKENTYVIGEDNELLIRVLSLDDINSSEFVPLEEIIIKK